MSDCAESICRSCFHSYVCEQFNEHRNSHNEKCHFFNDHFVPASDVTLAVRAQWEWFEEWLPSTPDHVAECEECGWRCSRCKTALEDIVGGYWDNPYKKPKLNFCPDCGADMREREDGDSNGMVET